MKKESKVIVMNGYSREDLTSFPLASAIQRLTRRELEVLVLICAELAPGEISRRLSISEKTYFNHRSSILLKTEARTNIGIYKFALRHGLVAD